MSQEEFGDDSVYINNLFDKETKQSDRSVLIDMTKLSRSKTINADELNSQMARKVQKITAIFPQVSKDNFNLSFAMLNQLKIVSDAGNTSAIAPHEVSLGCKQSAGVGI